MRSAVGVWSVVVVVVKEVVEMVHGSQINVRRAGQSSRLRAVCRAGWCAELTLLARLAWLARLAVCGPPADHLHCSCNAAPAFVLLLSCHMPCTRARAVNVA